MGSAEFKSWQVYSRVEPFGERRADQRTWLLVAAASNMMRDPKKGRAIDLADVLPEWRPPVDPMLQAMRFKASIEAEIAQKEKES